MQFLKMSRGVLMLGPVERGQAGHAALKEECGFMWGISVRRGGKGARRLRIEIAQGRDELVEGVAEQPIDGVSPLLQGAQLGALFVEAEGAGQAARGRGEVGGQIAGAFQGVFMARGQFADVAEIDGQRFDAAIM